VRHNGDPANGYIAAAAPSTDSEVGVGGVVAPGGLEGPTAAAAATPTTVAVVDAAALRDSGGGEAGGLAGMGSLLWMAHDDGGGCTIPASSPVAAASRIGKCDCARVAEASGSSIGAVGRS
tara:strand:- start:4721 stop:5083 length:363 start_codon:yes stop_codon:yes gene_type:complete